MPKFIEKILSQDIADFIDGGMDVDSFDLTEGRKRFLFDNAQAILDTTGRFRFSRIITRTSIGPSYATISQSGHDRLLKLLNRARREDPGFKAKTQGEVDKVKKETRRVSITSGNYFSLYSNTVVDPHKRELLINDILAQAPPYHDLLSSDFIKQVLMPLNNKSISQKDVITLLDTKFISQRNFIKNNYRALQTAKVIVIHSGGYHAHAVIIDKQNILAPLQEVARALKPVTPPSAESSSYNNPKLPAAIYLTAQQAQILASISVHQIAENAYQEQRRRVPYPSSVTDRQFNLVINPQIKNILQTQIQSMKLYLNGSYVDLGFIRRMSHGVSVYSLETNKIDMKATESLRAIQSYSFRGEGRENQSYASRLASYATKEDRPGQPLKHWIEGKNQKEIRSRISDYNSVVNQLTFSIQNLQLQKKQLLREIKRFGQEWFAKGLPRLARMDVREAGTILERHYALNQNTRMNFQELASESLSSLVNQYHHKLIKHDRLTSEINELMIQRDVIVNQKIPSYQEVLGIISENKETSRTSVGNLSNFVFGQGSKSRTAWSRWQGYSFDEIPISDLEHIVNDLGKYTKSSTLYALENGDVDLIYPYESKSTSYFRNIRDVQNQILAYLEGEGQKRKIAEQWDRINEDFKQDQSEADYQIRLSQLSPRPITVSHPSDLEEIERKTIRDRLDSADERKFNSERDKFWSFATDPKTGKQLVKAKQLSSAKRNLLKQKEKHNKASLEELRKLAGINTVAPQSEEPTRTFERVSYEQDTMNFMASYQSRWHNLDWIDELRSFREEWTPGPVIMRTQHQTNYGRLQEEIKRLKRVHPNANNKTIFHFLIFNYETRRWLVEAQSAYTRQKVSEKRRDRELYDSFLQTMTPEEASNEIFKIKQEQKQAEKGIDRQFHSYVDRVSKSQQYIGDTKEYRDERIRDHSIEEKQQIKEEGAHWVSGNREGQRQDIRRIPIYVPGYDRQAAKIWIGPENLVLPERRQEASSIRKELALVQKLVRSGGAHPDLSLLSSAKHYYIYTQSPQSVLRAKAHVLSKLGPSGLNILTSHEIAYLGNHADTADYESERQVSVVDVDGTRRSMPLWSAVHRKLQWATGRGLFNNDPSLRGLGDMPLSAPQVVDFASLKASYGPQRANINSTDPEDPLVAYLYGQNKQTVDTMFRRTRALSNGDEVRLERSTRSQNWDRDVNTRIDQKVHQMDFKIREIIQNARKARWVSQGGGRLEYYARLYDAMGLIRQFFYDVPARRDTPSSVPPTMRNLPRLIESYKSRRYTEARGSHYDQIADQSWRDFTEDRYQHYRHGSYGNRLFDLAPGESVQLRDLRQYLDGLNAMQDRPRSVVKELLMELEYEVQRGNAEFGLDIHFFPEVGLNPELSDTITPFVSSGDYTGEELQRQENYRNALVVSRANMPVDVETYSRLVNAYGSGTLPTSLEPNPNARLQAGSSTPFDISSRFGGTIYEPPMSGEFLPAGGGGGNLLSRKDNFNPKSTTEATVIPDRHGSEDWDEGLVSENADAVNSERLGIVGQGRRSVNPTYESSFDEADNPTTQYEPKYLSPHQVREIEQFMQSEGVQNLLADMAPREAPRPVDAENLAFTDVDRFEQEASASYGGPDDLYMTEEETQQSRIEGQTFIPPREK